MNKIFINKVMGYASDVMQSLSSMHNMCEGALEGTLLEKNHRMKSGIRIWLRSREDKIMRYPQSASDTIKEVILGLEYMKDMTLPADRLFIEEQIGYFKTLLECREAAV